MQSYLQLHQPVRRLRQDRKPGQLSAHHGNLVAMMTPGAYPAIFMDLVRKVLALCDFKTQTAEELRGASEQTDATDTMFLRFRQQCFDEPPASALALPPGRDRDGANLGEMGTVKMQRTTTDNARTVFQHHEIAHILTDLSQGSWQQGAVGGIIRDQSVDPLGIRQYGTTGAHEPPRKCLPFSASLRSLP